MFIELTKRQRDQLVKQLVEESSTEEMGALVKAFIVSYSQFRGADMYAISQMPCLRKAAQGVVGDEDELEL